MNFIVTSQILPKKCCGSYIKILHNDEVCYVKFNDDLDSEFVVRRKSSSSRERWEMVEKSTQKIRAFHLAPTLPEEITSTWTILSGRSTRKGLIKFVSVDNDPKRGQKRTYNDRGDGTKKKKMKRAFGRKVSQECKPLVTKHKALTKARLQILEDFPVEKKQLECDIATQDNELYSTSYVHEIMDYIRSVEADNLPSGSYMEKKQSNITITHRRQLLDFMNICVTKYRQKNATYHLAVNILDRFLSTRPVSKNQLQLIGCVCLWLAAKYVEVQVPSMDDFVLISDELFDTDEMCEMECEIVNALDFEFTVPTPLSFAERYGHVIKYMLQLEKQKRRLGHLINYFLEHCSLVYDFVGEHPSLIAASACYAAAVWLDRDFHWNETLEEEIGYTVAEMQRIVSIIKYEVYEKKRDPEEENLHVFEKYKTSKFENVALMRYARGTA